MITIFAYPETDTGFLETGETEIEYSCPLCCKAIRWIQNTQMSPYYCPGCRTILIDLTKLIGNFDWRIAYHHEGEIAVRCGSSPLA